MEKKYFAIKSYRCTAVSYDCWSRSVAFFFLKVLWDWIFRIQGYRYIILLLFLYHVFLASVAVPFIFFLFQGISFFFRTAFSVDVYKKKLKSRIKTLLIPYFVFGTL